MIQSWENLEVTKKISEDLQFTIWQVGLSRGICWILREDRKVKQICAKFVPCLFTDEKRQQKILADKNYLFPTLITCLIWPLLISSCFWKWENNDGIIFRMSLKFRNNDWPPLHVSKMSGPAVAEMLDLLHKLGKGLLWNGQNWPITEAGMYLVTNSASKVMDIPS